MFTKRRTLPLRVEQALADTGIFRVERGEQFADGGAVDFDGVEVVGQGAEGGGRRRDGHKYRC